MRLILADQSTAAKRRIYFDLRDATDGLTPETGEAGGQPQISTNGAAWTNTGIGVLVAIGNGRYYADLTQAAVATTGDVIETRYKSAATVETRGDSVQVTVFDLDDAVRGGVAYAGSRGPGVYIDDGAANTNTVDGVDGTWDNPVSTIAAATTIALSLGLQRFYLVNDTAITLAQTYESYEFIGIGEIMANVITLGSQNVDNSHFANVFLAGTQGGTGRLQAIRCVLGALAVLEVTAFCCILVGPLTVRDDCALDQCSSAVAGAGTPILDIDGVAGVNIYCRHYSGGLQINNAVATTVMSFEADGQLIIDATCTSLTIVVRGNCTITDNGTTTVLTQDGAVTRTSVNAEVVDALVTDTHAEPTSVPAATASIKDMLHWLFSLARNKGTQTSTTKTLRDDADGADIGAAPISDDGNTFTRGKWT